MAFAYTIDSKTPLTPSQKREKYSGKLVLLTGIFTNQPGDTGGPIPTGGDRVLFAAASDKTGANAVQVEHEATPGTIVLTTTDGDDGTWMAVIQQRNK